MRKLKIESHYNSSELKEIMDSQSSVRAFQNWQIIYLAQINPDKSAQDLSTFLGIKVSKVHRIVQTYNKQGKSWKPFHNLGGRREERCLLSLEEEAVLLKEIEQDALSGQILTYKTVKTMVETKINNSVSDDYVWDLFKRHGWNKKVPRKHHPLRDEEKQEEAKKNSKRTWQPNH